MLAISVTVPSVSARKLITSAERAMVLATVQDQLARSFGGCTTTDGQGAWLDSQDKPITESVSVVTSYTDCVTWLEKSSEINHLARYVARALDQDSVLLVVSPVDSVIFVPQHEE